MTRRRHVRGADARRRQAIVGLAACALLAVIAVIANEAHSGLPWQRVHTAYVSVPTAAGLVHDDDVRIAGVRVGRVAQVQVVRASGTTPVHARIELALNAGTRGLPLDTRVRVATGSVLGAKYVDLTPGTAARTLDAGGELPLANARSEVELTDALDIFSASERRAFTRTFAGIGYGLAGRGQGLNATLAAVSPLMTRLRTVSATLAGRRAHLGRFLQSYDALMRTFSSSRDALGGVVTGGSSTLGAFDRERPALVQAIDDLAPAEAAGTDALVRLTPTLTRLTGLLDRVRPGTRELPDAVDEINGALRAGTPAAGLLPSFARRTGTTLTKLGAVAGRSSTDGAIRKLADFVDAGRRSLALLADGQSNCNIVSLFMANMASSLSGFRYAKNGPYVVPLSLTHIGAEGETFQQPKPSSNVGINYYPNENAQECEAGNEPHDGKTQRLNNPEGNQSTAHVQTSEPAAAEALAREAGLITTPRGAR